MIAVWRIVVFIPFSRLLATMSRIWTQVTMSISHDSNNYSTASPSSYLSLSISLLVYIYICIYMTFRCLSLNIICNFPPSTPNKTTNPANKTTNPYCTGTINLIYWISSIVTNTFQHIDFPDFCCAEKKSVIFFFLASSPFPFSCVGDLIYFGLFINTSWFQQIPSSAFGWTNKHSEFF